MRFSTVDRGLQRLISDLKNNTGAIDTDRDNTLSDQELKSYLERTVGNSRLDKGLDSYTPSAMLKKVVTGPRQGSGPQTIEATIQLLEEHRLKAKTIWNRFDPEGNGIFDVVGAWKESNLPIISLGNIGTMLGKKPGLEGLLDCVKADIAVLEMANHQKATEIENLTRELEKTLAGHVMMGRVGLGTLIAGILTGAGLFFLAGLGFTAYQQQQFYDLTERIERTKLHQQAIQDKLKSYDSLKQKTEQGLDELKSYVIRPALNPIENRLPRELQRLLQDSEAVASAAIEQKRLETELRLLESLRDAARQLGIDLDVVLVPLRRDVAEAKEALGRSQQFTLQLMLVLLQPGDLNVNTLNYLIGKAKEIVEAKLWRIVGSLPAVRELRSDLQNDVTSRLVASLTEGLAQ